MPPQQISFDGKLVDAQQLIDGLNAAALKQARSLLQQNNPVRSKANRAEALRLIKAGAGSLVQRLPSRDLIRGLLEGALDGVVQRLPSRRTVRRTAVVGLIGISTVAVVTVLPWSAWFKQAAENFSQPAPKPLRPQMDEAIRYAKRSFNLQAQPRGNAASSAIRVNEGMGALTGPGAFVDERGNTWTEVREFGSRKVLGYADVSSLTASPMPEPVLDQGRQQVLYAKEPIDVAGQDGDGTLTTNFAPGDAVLVRRINTVQGASYAQVILPADRSTLASINLQKLTAFPLLGRQADSLGRVWVAPRGDAQGFQRPQKNAQVVSRVAGGTPLLVGEHYLEANGERWASVLDPRTGRYSGFFRARELEALSPERLPPAAPAAKGKSIRFQQNTP